MHYLAVFIIMIGLGASYWFGYTPPLVALVYVLVSLLTFFIYGYDKSAAEKGTWRVSENRLHLLSLLSGWPGAIIGQKVFRHKTRKTNFQLMFWFTVLVNCGALISLHTAEGRPVLDSATYMLKRFTISHVSDDLSRHLLLKLLVSHQCGIDAFREYGLCRMDFDQ